VLVVTLIALGSCRRGGVGDIDGIEKAELKRTLIRELRRELHGTTAEQLAKAVEAPNLKVLKLLEEMQAQGLTECRTDTRRVTTGASRAWSHERLGSLLSGLLAAAPR